MLMVMCEACGSFLPGMNDGEDVVPIKDACPDCGASEFRSFPDAGD